MTEHDKAVVAVLKAIIDGLAGHKVAIQSELQKAVNLLGAADPTTHKEKRAILDIGEKLGLELRA